MWKSAYDKKGFCLGYLHAEADHISYHHVITNSTEEDQHGMGNVEFYTSAAIIPETVQTTRRINI